MPVSVPKLGEDRPPTLTVVGFPVDNEAPEYAACVVPETSSTTQKVKVLNGTNVMVWATGSNPGGVKQLSVEVILLDVNGIHLEDYTVVTQATLPLSGKVPQNLFILGSDGNGHVGNQPIMMPMWYTTKSAVVIATAENFNGQSSSITVSFGIVVPTRSPFGCNDLPDGIQP
jgi:hypothetical protein